MSDYFVCPHCYAEVPSGAPACPKCGSDEETGWSEDTAYDGLFLPHNEMESEQATSVPWLKYVMGVVALLTLTAFVASSLRATVVYLLPLLLAVSVAYFVIRARSSAYSIREKQLYVQLVRRARGDEELVERLVDYERRRKPGAERLELLENVLYHWERDSR